MTKLGTALKSAAFGALALGAMSGGAYAGSTTEPGVTLGGAPGAGVPEGVYFIDNFNWGNDRASTHDQLGIEVPLLLWATPYHILGGQLILAGTVPLVYSDVNGLPLPPQEFAAFGNVGASLAWSLGGGFHISQTFDIYTPGIASNEQWVPEWRTGISYLGGGWNLSANIIVGFGTSSIVPSLFPKQNDYVNVDLAAIKTLGKWQLGVVAFGSSDTNVTGANITTGKQSQFAVGGLVGYEWGPVNTQVYYTHDVDVQHYGPSGSKGVEDSRIWTSLVVPLWTAPHESYK